MTSMPARQRGGRGRPARTYPYEITCPGCDLRLVAINLDWVVLVGPQPVELVGNAEGDVHIVCHGRGTLVAIDRELLVLR